MSALPIDRPKGPIEAATSPAAAAATASLAKPMDQLRGEAFGGPGFQGPMKAPGALAGPAGPMGPKGPASTQGLAFDPSANRPLLGSMEFKNLQPRNSTAPMLPRPAGGAGDAPMSHAGFTTYFDEKTGGASLATRRGRSGARFTGGPSKGKTADQAKLGLREQYAKLSPEEKARYEGKANNLDISSPSQAPAPVAPASEEVATPTPVDPAAQPKSLGTDELDLNKDLAMKRRIPVKPMLPGRMMA